MSAPKCPRCKIHHVNTMTAWSEMMKPVEIRVHTYSCEPCNARWTQEELDNEIEALNQEKDAPISKSA